MTDHIPPSRSTRGTRLPKAAVLVLPACAALLVLAAVIAGAEDVPLADLLRDTTAVLEAPFYVGLISNAGILLWGATTAIGLFTAAVLSASRRTTSARPETGVGTDTGPGAGFFAAGAGVSAWLLLDDALLFHEQVFDAYLGLPGELSLAIGAGATAAFLIGYRRTILAGDYPLLLAALLLLGASATVDQLFDLGLLGPLVLHSHALETFIEDSLKLCGIAFWASYFTLAARDRCVAASGTPASDRGSASG